MRLPDLLSPSNVPACNGLLKSFIPVTVRYIGFCCQVLHDGCLVHLVNIYLGMHALWREHVVTLMPNCVALYTALVVDGHAFHVELVISD